VLLDGGGSVTVVVGRIVIVGNVMVGRVIVGRLMVEMTSVVVVVAEVVVVLDVDEDEDELEVDDEAVEDESSDREVVVAACTTDSGLPKSIRAASGRSTSVVDGRVEVGAGSVEDGNTSDCRSVDEGRTRATASTARTANTAIGTTLFTTTSLPVESDDQFRQYPAPAPASAAVYGLRDPSDR
jgi:hypothetical protein